MKKILFILAALFITVHSFSQVSTCCPEFALKQLGDTRACEGDSACSKDPNTGGGNPNQGGQGRGLVSCKNTAQTYYVVPNLPGFTFTWTVIGGAIGSITGNPKIITWGSGAEGFIQVIITNPSGNCRDTITAKVCLLNSPVAAFTASMDTVCANSTPIIFTNTSAGASSYSWDFGDGSGSNLPNPLPHIYSTPGTYTVLLTVFNSTGGTGGPVGETHCGCSDTASMVVTVLAGTGPEIISSCKKMLCPNDTTTYCVTPGCAPFNWIVNGGTIINTSGNCITVQWNATPPITFPASVSVTTGCGGLCGNAATLTVPVIWNNMPINGPSPVCVGSTTTYSLPVMPGTFYTWAVSGGGGSIVGPNQNTASINVQWAGPAGTATITCSYNNPYSGCSGSSTITVNVRNKFKVTGPGVVCTGIPAAYNSNGAANWVIIPGTGFTSGSLTSVSTINVNWTTAGAYTITATATNPAGFCNPNAVINVVVNPTPVLTSIVGPTSVCPGSYYTYRVTSSLAGPFVWTPSVNGTIISPMGTNNDSVIVQWMGAGPHTITASQTVFGCTGTKTLSPINNVPAVTITGPAAVCRDQSPNPLYTASGALPAGSYTWTISPAAAGTIMTGQGTNQIGVLWSGAVTPGTNTATVSVVVCNYAPVNFPVSVTTPPNVTVTKTGSLCTLPGVTLSVSPSLLCYQWYLNGVAIGGATSATYVATTFGYYEVKCPTQCSGYGGIYVPKEYIPNVTISANNKTIFCTTETINVTLFSAASGGCTYQWFKNGLPLGSPSGTNSPLPVTTVGIYYQVVSCGNCKDTSNAKVVSVITCGPGPGCDLSVLPALLPDNMDIGGPVIHEKIFDANALAATLTIGPPSNLCNNPQFSAVTTFTSPHTLNAGINWFFGDGGTYSTTISGGFTPAHTYTSVGIYVVTAQVFVNCPPPPNPHICELTDTIHYVVPVAAKFSASVNCEKVYLTSLATVLSPCTITAHAWSATGPGGVTFSNSSAANPLMTVTASGTYSVTLTVTSSCNGCTATITLPITVSVPSAGFTVPTPVCAGTPISFNASGGMMNYLWNFGDTFTSTLQSPTHTFGLTPASPTITLTVSNALGCTATTSNTISVVAPPVLSITPLQKICPGATTTITATGAGFTTFDFYHNGTLVQSGPSNTYSTGAIGSYYVIANNAGGVCAVKSAWTYIFNYPKPIADIRGSSVACLSAGIAYINLYNSVNDPTSAYSWNLQGNATVLSTLYTLNTTVNVTGNYSYIITVTDSSGCIARDTLCVVVANTPAVSVITPGGTLCSGVSHIFQATPYNPAYSYSWSNGASGQYMSTSLPGMYMVTVTDLANGCFSSAFAGVIQPRPSTILFPIGCDTLCDYDSIIPPLALGGPYSPGSYTVEWILNGNFGSPIFIGPVLNLLVNIPPLVYGMNNISIIVTYNGCKDTSNAYNLFIKKCDSCDCKESYFGETVITAGESPTAANPIPLLCGGNQKLDCNKTYTISSFYNCSDTACAGKVTYSLQPPTGPAITGTGSISFTTNLPGTYILTMYGWCGDIKCDSCIIKFDVKCCDCKNSKWDKITLAPGNPQPVDDPVEAKANIPNPNIPNPVVIGLNCNKTYNPECNKPYTLNAGFICGDPACPGKVTYSLQPPTGLPITGSLPPAFNFTATQSGTYVLTMYGWCGNKICDSCVVKFVVKCDCDCGGSKWVEQSYTINNTSKPINCNNNKPEEVKVKCNIPVTVNAMYNCVGANCPGTVTYSMQPPTGLPQTGNMPPSYTFTPGQTGTYTLTMYGWCGGKICDSCVIKFTTDCVKDSSCCPYNITAKPPSVQTSTITNPAATVASGSFSFTGPAGNLFTEVRAEVVSYTLTDNYDQACLSCKSYPFSWASIYQPGTIGSMLPQITMYNAVVNAFNPAGNGMYQNPREVTWSSATPFALPPNINISFLLPPASIIDCCELKARICVKFTFRNNDCKECEVLVCFSVPIKKR